MLKRYTIETPPYGRGRMEFDEDGDWVKFDDIVELLRAAQSVASWDWNALLMYTESNDGRNDLEALENALKWKNE